jgi:hypothetical protein
MLCCEDVRIRDIPKIKSRRCRRGKLKMELPSVETGGGAGCSSPTLSTDQLELFKTGE